MIIIFHYLCLVTKHFLRSLKKMPINVPSTEEASLDTQDAEVNLLFDPPVYKQRYGEIQLILLNNKWIDDIRKIVDFGCAEFKLFQFINRLHRINDILVVDIDECLLRENLFRVRPLTTDYINKRTDPLNIHVLQGSISDPEHRLIGVDAVIGIEIIEHLYPDTLEALPYNVFGFIKPKLAVFTTPNADFNVLFPNFKGMRHYDHKFEWTREQFEMWANNIVTRFPNYSVSFKGIGEGPPGTEHLGCCSQMAIFIKIGIEDKVVIDSEASFGICTYHSKVCNMFIEREPNSYYHLIELIEYPFNKDERTVREKISDELQYKIGLASRLGGRFYNEERNKIEIPVVELIYNLYTHFTSIPEACSILTEVGFNIEECLVCDQLQICVIHEPVMENGTKSSSTTLSDSYEVDLDHDQWLATLSDPESDWGVDSDPQKNEKLQFDASTLAQQLLYEIIDNLETNAENAGISNEGDEHPSISSESNNHMCDSGYGVSSLNLTSSAHSNFDGAFDIQHDSQTTNKLPDYNINDHVDDYQEARTVAVLQSPMSEIKSTGQPSNSANDSTCVNAVPVEGKPELLLARIQKEPQQDYPLIDEVNVEVGLLRRVEQDYGEVYDIFEEVENGDLANNNRDIEGNNYPNAIGNVLYNDNENVVFQNIDDERDDDVQNRNQIEEYPIVAEVDQPAEEPNEGQIDFEVHNSSREALFDPNSQEDLLEDYDVAADGDQNVDQPASEIILVALDPATDNEEVDARAEMHDGAEVHDEPHFYCQGDGLGVHPSFVEDDFEEESSSDRTLSSDNSQSSSSDDHSHNNAEAEPSLSEVDVGSLPEDTTDPSLQPVLRIINIPIPLTLQPKKEVEEKPDLVASSPAGSSGGTTSPEEFFDTLDEPPLNDSLSQKHIRDPKPKK